MTTKAAILRAVKGKCDDCSCYQPREVKLCTVNTCTLWPFRFGKDPSPSSSRGFAKTNGYTGGSEKRQPDQSPSKKKPHREFKSRQGISPKPITPNDKDQKK